MNALFSLSYGLYVVTSHDGKHDNGMICNTVMQVANDPTRLAVCINKANYSHDVIQKSGKLNVNCLSTDAPFKLFQCFGFRSGRDTDKFADYEGEVSRSANGLIVLGSSINAWLSLDVVQYVDLGSHGMFICTISESEGVNNKESMTYTYYHANVKPKPQAQVEKKKGWVCKICGYVYEGESLPEGYICPVCKHPAEDFEPLK